MNLLYHSTEISSILSISGGSLFTESLVLYAFIAELANSGCL